MLDQLFDPNNPLLWILLLSIIAAAIMIMARPFSSFIKFAYPNAKFEAMGNPYVHDAPLQKLLDVQNLDGFIEQLNADKDYDLQGETAQDVQHQLDQHFLRFITMMKQDSSKKLHQFYDYFLEYLDVSTITTAVYLRKQKEPITDALIAQTISPKGKRICTALADESIEDISSLLSDLGITDEDSALILSEETPIVLVDILIERVFLHQLLHVKVPYKCKEGIQRFCKRLLDIHHLKHLLRAKNLQYKPELCQQLFLFDGFEIPQWKFTELCQQSTIKEIIQQLEGTSYYAPLKQRIDQTLNQSSAQRLSTALDALFLTLVNAICLEFYVTIGPTLRFLTAKQYEITNLKIIAKGTAEQIPSDFMKQLLIMEESTR